MKKQAALIPATELALTNKALTLKGEINALHRETLRAGNEMMKNAVRCGQLLGQVKEILKASKSTTFENWVDQNLDVSYRSARSYMLLSNKLEELQNWQSSAILRTADSISEAFRLIESTKPDPAPAKSTPTSPPPASRPSVSATADVGADGSGGGREIDQDDPQHPLYVPEGPEPDLSTPDTVDRGRCPNCAGTKWTDDEDGARCAKCRHPYGEATGGVDEDRIATQRSKTIKTVEALQRAFDDLHLLLPKPEHGKAVEGCKVLLRMAKGWK